LEFEHRFGGSPLVLGEDVQAGEQKLSVSRLDYLVSGFALQTESGEWIEADPKLVGFISEARDIRSVDLGDVPAGKYSKLRFHIGPAAEQNAADPNSFPAGHALHPIHCGLHWGWQGGYIFIALEGHLPDGGFSYHLAEDRNRTAIEFEIELDLHKRATALIRFDVSKVFLGDHRVKPGEGEVTTHSRDGDPLPAKIRSSLKQGFEFVWARPELFHAPVKTGRESAAGERTPYDLRVSSRLPAYEVPLDNPLTAEGVALGRRLFFDPILSKDGTVSCASCHEQARAFTDGRVVGEGVGGAQGARNSMSLVNLLWASEMFWDGHSPNLREQVLEPIQDPREMGETLASVVRKLVEAEGYPEAFERAFGERAVTPTRIAKALEQFLLTLVSQDSRFDRAMRGEAELSAEERRGFQLFVGEKDPALGLHGADCFHCHGGSLFTNNGFANNGLALAADDTGRFVVTEDEVDRGKFKVPSLRNVALTAPYMHDGRFTTLEEVVEHYDHGVVRGGNLDPNIAKHPKGGLGLSEDEKAALVAFLRTLTDEQFVGK
jgi:cytochrome c peroxidase